MTTTENAPLSKNGAPGGRAAGGAASGGGARPAAAPAGSRLPSAPRERRPALAALAVLLILGGALVSTSLVLSSGDRVSAIALSANVQAGQQIPREALVEVKVPRSDGPRYVTYNDANVKAASTAYARYPLVKGSLLLQEQTMSSNEAERGQVSVGLVLKPGQFPAELSQGQIVAAYQVGEAGTGTRRGNGTGNGPLVAKARVLKVNAGDGKNRLAGGDETFVTVAVDEQDAGVLAPVAAKGDVVLVLLPAGGN
jgi:hypothetical protein